MGNQDFLCSGKWAFCSAMSQHPTHGENAPVWVSRVGWHCSWHSGRKLFLCKELRWFDKHSSCPPLV